MDALVPASQRILLSTIYHRLMNLWRGTRRDEVFPLRTTLLMQWIFGTPRFAANWLSKIINFVVVGCAAGLILGLFLVHLRATISSQHFTPYSLVEETAYTLISAQNYLKFGFRNSAFLQDFSTSQDPVDHPYVYDHMPAGPDITQALLLKLTGGSFEASRIIFSLTALVGFFIYYLFTKKLLARFGLRGAGIALLMPGAWQIIQLFERQIYSPFCILCFLPLYMYLRYLENGRTWQLIVACSVAFLSSVYLEYTVLAAISACWLGFYVTRLIPVKTLHFAMIATSIACGVILHLIQNMIYLGWSTFVLELSNTLSNRITGYPSPEDLQSFYRSIGVLHHGARPVVPHALLAQLSWNFDFPGVNQIALLALTSLLVMVCTWALRRREGPQVEEQKTEKQEVVSLFSDVRFFLRLAIWLVFSVISSILLFPAFSQEVTIRGSVGPFFLGIAVGAVIDYAIQLVAAYSVSFFGTLCFPNTQCSFQIDRTAGSSPAALRVVTITACMLALLLSTRALIGFASSNVAIIRSHWSMIGGTTASFGPSYDLLGEVDRFAGQPFMTNINVPAIGLFTRSVGFGVCAPESIGQNGIVSVDQCKILMARRYAYWASIRPRYFVYLNDRRMFPGFADCLPGNTYVGQSRRDASCMDDLLSRLSTQYPLVLKNDLLRVFDLSLPGKNATR